MTYLFISEDSKTFTLKNQMFEYFSDAKFIRFEQSPTITGFHKIHVNEYRCVTIPACECVINMERKGAPNYASRKSLEINLNI